MIAGLQRFSSPVLVPAVRPPSTNHRHPRAMRDLTIGEVARQAGVSVQTVRYYERRGMLPAPRRAESGYRKYPPETVSAIRFVRRAQHLGFTLAEVEELRALRDRRDHQPVHAMAIRRLEGVEQDLRRLAQAKEKLQALLQACDRAASDLSCALLRALDEEKDA